jgi:integrase/recombinase XerC
MRCQSLLPEERRYGLSTSAVPTLAPPTPRGLLLLALRTRGGGMTRITFSHEPLAWVADLRRSGRSKSTIDAYGADLVSVAIALERIVGNPVTTASLSRVGQQEIDAMESLWSEQGVVRATILRRFAALRGFARFLSTRGHNCSGILAASLPKPKRLPPRAAPDHVVQLISEPTGNGWIALRDASVIRVLTDTGATVAEVVAIDCSQVFWEAGGVALAVGSPAARLATLSDETLAAIETYQKCAPSEFSQQGPLFLNRDGARLTARSVQVMLAQRATELGMPGRASAMKLRHRYGQMLAEAGHSLEIVAERLGISVSTATKYFSLPRHRADPARNTKRAPRGRRPTAATRRPYSR